MRTSRFMITFIVNSEATCTLENLPLEEVYENSVFSEMFSTMECNRWRVLDNEIAARKMEEMIIGKSFIIAHQIMPSNLEMDTETIFIARTS